MNRQKMTALLTLATLFFSVSFYASAETAKLDFTTDKNEYNIGDTVKIRGTTDANDVTLSIVSLFPLDALKTVNVVDGKFSYDYQTLPGDSGKALIHVEVSGDYASEKEKQIFIQKNGSNSALYVELITPASNERFYRENNLTIKLRVTKNETPINDAKVFCKLAFPGSVSAGITIELFPVGEFFTDTYKITENDIKKGGVYYSDYQIGRGDPTQVWVIKCVAQKAEEQGGVSRPVRVVNSLILIDFLSPTEAAVDNGAKLNVVARAYYQDGNPVKNAVVLLQDSDGRLAKMDKLSDSGVYEFKNYDTTSNNNYLSLTVSAGDDVGNAGKKSIVLRIVKNSLPEMVYRLWWTFPMVITIILLTIYLEKQMELSYTENVSRPKKLKSQIIELEEDKQNITESRASVEENYYKRKIDEKTFRRMMEDYEQKSIEIDIKIKRLKEELREFE